MAILLPSSGYFFGSGSFTSLSLSYLTFTKPCGSWKLGFMLISLVSSISIYCWGSALVKMSLLKSSVDALIAST